MNYQNLSIDQKINMRMVSLVLRYTLTKHPTLRRVLPSNCKTKAVYNTCYDLGRMYVDNELVNGILSNCGDRAKEYITNNLPKYKYLKVELVLGSVPNQFKHSFTNELPYRYRELERTSFVKFMKTEEVEIK